MNFLRMGNWVLSGVQSGFADTLGTPGFTANHALGLHKFDGVIRKSDSSVYMADLYNNLKREIRSIMLYNESATFQVEFCIKLKVFVQRMREPYKVAGTSETSRLLERLGLGGEVIF